MRALPQSPPEDPTSKYHHIVEEVSIYVYWEDTIFILWQFPHYLLSKLIRIELEIYIKNAECLSSNIK